MPKRLVSGIKPTGDIHIGNYFGAIQQFIERQDEYESFIFIADLHALNQVQEPRVLSANIHEIAKAYLAVGLDPEKVCFFKQSDIPAHAELCWIFGCLTSMGALERAHAYKDAVAKNKPVNLGLFAYPVLMAADILLYRPEVVPVGNDQQQHLEMTVDIAERFNHLFGATFTIPQALIRSQTSVVKGLDGRKMSKSYNNTIGLFDSPEAVTKKVLSIQTDSRGPSEPKDPSTCNVFALHQLFSKNQLSELDLRYREGNISYKESKDILAENINNFLNPIRQKKDELDQRPEYIEEILFKGKEKALTVAELTIKEVKERVGLQ